MIYFKFDFEIIYTYVHMYEDIEVEHIENHFVYFKVITNNGLLVIKNGLVIKKKVLRNPVLQLVYHSYT